MLILIVIFQHDLRLRKCSRQDFPLPDYFTFVFTDVKGRHLHAACLRFYEIVPQEEVRNVFSTTYGELPELLDLGAGMEIFSPKVICVLSQYPFYRAMGRLLRQLYSLSLSPTVVPLEHFLVATVAKVPLPLAGGRPYDVVLDAGLISPTSKAMAPIRFELPPDRFFPPMDLDFAGPLRCLSVENMLTIFTLLLREVKMIFICCSNALLTEVMETFRSLLFPLSWSSSFITRLPDALCSLLQAPGGFMIGLQVVEAAAASVETAAYIRVGAKKYEKRSGWPKFVSAGTYIVDLSENAVYLFEGCNGDTLQTSRFSGSTSVLKLLPQGPRRRLEAKLQAVASKYGIGPQTSGLEQFDSAFEFQNFSPDGTTDTRRWEDFPTLEIRDSFMALMIDILGNYSAYMVPPESNIEADGYRSFKEEFLCDKYTNDADKGCKQLLVHLLETQMFSVLLQQRGDIPVHFNLEYFESVSRLFYFAGLSALPPSDKRLATLSRPGYAAIAPLNISDLPAPLFVLYAEYLHIQSSMSIHKALQGLVTAGSGVLKQQTGRANGFGNRLLDELMILMLTPDLKRTMLPQIFREEDGTLTILRERSRLELLAAGGRLVLSDAAVGPLVLPGPLLKAGENPGGERPLYRYASGWPSLQSELLMAEGCAHPSLPHIASQKLSSDAMVGITCSVYTPFFKKS